MIGSSEHVEISSFRGQLLLIMQKTQPPSLIPDLPISGIKLVVHGPELIDTGRVALVVEALGAIGPLRVLAGGTMARVAALDKHLTFIDTSQNLHTSDALNDVSDNEVPVLANCGKTPSTGCVFGQIVSSRVRRSIVHVEGPGSVRGKVIVWRGVDGGLWRCVQYIAEQLSHRLSLELVEQNKKALPVEQTSEVITRRIHGAKPGELLLIEGMVVGTAVDSDVVISAQNGSIVDITGVNTKAHGLERIGEIDLIKAYVKSGQLRRGNETCNERSMLPARPLKRGTVTFVNHCADRTLESVDGTTICAITVGDDTTAISGDVLSRIGIPIIGITDGDDDGLYSGACTIEGSVILHLNNASDDDVGFVLEQSGALSGRNHSLADVIAIVTDFLCRRGVEFSSLRANK